MGGCEHAEWGRSAAMITILYSLGCANYFFWWYCMQVCCGAKEKQQAKKQAKKQAKQQQQNVQPPQEAIPEVVGRVPRLRSVHPLKREHRDETVVQGSPTPVRQH